MKDDEQGGLFSVARPGPKPVPNVVPKSVPKSVPPPTIRIVHSKPRSQVVVEVDGPGHFFIGTSRDYGTTLLSIRVTRAQLEKLLTLIPEALGK